MQPITYALSRYAPTALGPVSNLHLARSCSALFTRTCSYSTASLLDPFGPVHALPLHRVVVTGIGIVSPLAVGAQATWDRLIKGHTATRRLTPEDVPEVIATDGMLSFGECSIGLSVTRVASKTVSTVKPGLAPNATAALHPPLYVHYPTPRHALWNDHSAHKLWV